MCDSCQPHLAVQWGNQEAIKAITGLHNTEQETQIPFLSSYLLQELRCHTCLTPPYVQDPDRYMCVSCQPHLAVQWGSQDVIRASTETAQHRAGNTDSICIQLMVARTQMVYMSPPSLCS